MHNLRVDILELFAEAQRLGGDQSKLNAKMYARYRKIRDQMNDSQNWLRKTEAYRAKRRTGKPPGRKEKGPPACHPDRRYEANGMCKACYERARRGNILKGNSGSTQDGTTDCDGV